MRNEPRDATARYNEASDHRRVACGRNAPRNHHHDRPRYPSDLSDQQWNRVVSILSEHERSQQDRTSLREIVNAINFRWRTGCAWRMLPHDFPPWTTVYAHFRRWRALGLLTAMRSALLRRDRQRLSESPNRQQAAMRN